MPPSLMTIFTTYLTSIYTKEPSLEVQQGLLRSSVANVFDDVVLRTLITAP